MQYKDMEGVAYWYGSMTFPIQLMRFCWDSLITVLWRPLTVKELMLKKKLSV